MFTTRRAARRRRNARSRRSFPSSMSSWGGSCATRERGAPNEPPCTRVEGAPPPAGFAQFCPRGRRKQRETRPVSRVVSERRIEGFGRLSRRRKGRTLDEVVIHRGADGARAAALMYGNRPVEFPQRIVRLTAETTEIAFMVGAGDRVVGVPGTARRPETARQRARVGGFTTFRTDRILALQPDLLLGFSDLQRDIVAELTGVGVTVLCTNQRRLDEVLAAILLIGGALCL